MGPQFNVKGTEGVGRQASHLKGQQHPLRLIKSVTDPRPRCSPLKTQYPRGSCWRKGKLLLIRVSDLGRRRTYVSPKNNSEDCTWSWSFLRERRKSSQLVFEKGARVIPATNPLHCRVLSFCDLPLDIMLFTQFVHKITEGKAREEIWSSVNYLVFISLIYRKNQQVRQSIVWSKDLESVLGQRWAEHRSVWNHV